MRVKLFHWLHKEFVALSCEGKAATTADEEMREVLERFDAALRGLNLSLDNTVRTRLWARDKDSRRLASIERLEVLSGKARSSSSSFIAPQHLDSDANVALDLLAMRPSEAGAEKILKEYDPPVSPLRSLRYDNVVFLSGVTSALPALSDQVPDVIGHIRNSLTDAGSSWDRAVKVSFLLHRNQKLEDLKEAFTNTVKAKIPQMEFSFVDGYAGERNLIEIEVTALG
jgi:enamine deaminase RidA (YjgF/YER057c/UK114 family)